MLAPRLVLLLIQRVPIPTLMEDLINVLILVQPDILKKAVPQMQHAKQQAWGVNVVTVTHQNGVVTRMHQHLLLLQPLSAETGYVRKAAIYVLLIVEYAPHLLVQLLLLRPQHTQYPGMFLLIQMGVVQKMRGRAIIQEQLFLERGLLRGRPFQILPVTLFQDYLPEVIVSVYQHRRGISVLQQVL